MSLTSELKSAKSWVNHFFKERFPYVDDFARCKAAEVNSMEIVVSSRSAGSVQLVGTAFDYRLRIHFETEFVDSSVPMKGIDRLCREGSGLGSSVDRKWSEATAKLLVKLPTGDDDLMARASVVLAWLDWGFRRPGMWSDGLRAVADSTRGGDVHGWDSYAASVDAGVAAEVAALMDIARPPQADRVLCGTSFGGSAFVGGADSDLILDGCLYDVKTTLRPRRHLAAMLRQLLGYGLLDWDDEFGLDRVGFYWSRQGKWMSWNLAEMIERGANPEARLRRLREDFKRRAHEQAPAFLRSARGM